MKIKDLANFISLDELVSLVEKDKTTNEASFGFPPVPFRLFLKDTDLKKYLDYEVAYVKSALDTDNEWDATEGIFSVLEIWVSGEL